MTQKNKKQKGRRETKNISHRTGTILEIIEIKYVAKVLCWCGETLTIDSSKSLIENQCPQCGSPYKLIDQEWTPEEQNKYMELKGLK